MSLLLHITTVPQTLAFLEGQAAFLRRNGFETQVVSSSGPELDRFCAQESITGHVVEMTRQITPLSDMRAIRRLSKLFSNLRPRIVHAHTPKAGLLAMIAASLHRIPVRIFHLHGLPHMTARGLRRHALRFSTRIACAFSHRVLCVSFSIRNAAITEGLVQAHKIVVPANGSINGVDAEHHFNPSLSTGDIREVRQRLGIAPESRVVGFVGRVVVDKGIREFVEAWKRLRVDFPDLHWLIVGCEESHDPLPEPVAAFLKNDPRVHLTGWSHDLPELYLVMDLVVLPSYREGFPVVPLEAAAMGLPVVATRIPGTIEAVEDSHTGTLIETHNSDEIVRAVTAYLSDASLRCAHGEAGRQRVIDRFQPETIWKATEQHYLEMLGSRSHRSKVKRVLDIVCSSLGLVLLSPVLAVVALSILLTVGRPILFRQRRPGLHEKCFEILKFRTMIQGEGPDGERVTRIGKVLRALSLDELPQLWNVLKGDMSLVGPRPLLMEYLPRYNESQRRRHDAKPGITGWAQIQGRNEVSWSDRFALDLWYVENWSLWLDVKILRRTFGQALSRRGISEPGAATMTPFGGNT